MSHTMSLELSQELLRNSIIGLAGEPVFVDFESFLFVATRHNCDTSVFGQSHFLWKNQCSSV